MDSFDSRRDEEDTVFFIIKRGVQFFPGRKKRKGSELLQLFKTRGRPSLLRKEGDSQISIKKGGGKYRLFLLRSTWGKFFS